MLIRRCSNRATLPLLLLVMVGSALVDASAARADSWVPPPTRIVPDPGGQFGLYLRPSGNNVEFTLFAGAAGARVLPEQKSGDTPIALPEKHRVLARGTLSLIPHKVLVSGKLGFVFVDRWGGLGWNDCVLVIGVDGQERSRLQLSDLFENPEELFQRSVSSTWWYSQGWINDATEELVLVSKAEGENQLRVVPFSNGKVRKGGLDDITAALSLEDHAAARSIALELLVSYPPGIEKERIAQIYETTSSPREKVRAGALLAANGDFRARQLYQQAFEAAQQPTADGHPVDHIEYALIHSSRVLGAECEQRLMQLMKGEAGPYWHACQRGFVRHGDAAIGTLTTMATDAEGAPDYRGGACHALRQIGSKKGVAALLQVAADPNEYVANAAVNAAISLAGSEIAGELLVLLEKGSTQDGRIAMYFQEHKHARAREVLEELLAQPRAGWPGYMENVLRSGIAFQRS